MANRANQTNTSGTVAAVAGNMPASTSTHSVAVVSRATVNKPVTAVVLSNNHAVEVDGDGGVWDTVSNVAVPRDKTNLDTINL